jgi:ribosome-binding protein aMBF1 (putative translation factor)
MSTADHHTDASPAMAATPPTDKRALQVLRTELLHALGRAVRARRYELGLSQLKLSIVSGINHNYIGSIEQGKRNVAIVNLRRLAWALELTLTELMARVEEEAARTTHGV